MSALSAELEQFSDAELLCEIEARDAWPEPPAPDIGDFSDEEMAEEFTRREIPLDFFDVLQFIERELWSPSDWARLQGALAVAVKPRCAA